MNPQSLFQGIDVLLQLGTPDPATGGVECSAYTGISTSPVRILVVPDSSAEAVDAAEALHEGVASLLEKLTAAAAQVTPPCRGVRVSPLGCMATDDENVLNVLVWVGATAATLSGDAFVSGWLAQGDRFRAVGAVREDADLDTVLPAGLAPTQALRWRDDPAQTASAVLSVAHVTPAENRVFVSYRHGEGDALAGELFHLLAEARFDVFLDRFAIEPGTDWLERLEEELADKAFVLVVETATVHSSQWIKGEIDFARKHRLGLAGIEHGGEAPGIGEARRLRLGPTGWLSTPQPLVSGRPSHLPQGVVDRILDFVQERHARALARRRRLLDLSLRRALAREGVEPNRIRRAAGGIDVGNGAGCAIALSVRPPRLEEFHAVDRRAAAIAAKPVLVGPDAAGAARRATIDWLADRSNVAHYNEGRLLELARTIAAGACS
jgi:hypothetical protein